MEDAWTECSIDLHCSNCKQGNWSSLFITKDNLLYGDCVNCEVQSYLIDLNKGEVKGSCFS